MDLVDKSILLEYGTNCRISYQTLANRLGLTVNAIKKRVNKMLEIGVIQRYYIYLSLAMMDAEWLLARVLLEENHFDEGFLETIGANPMVFGTGYLSDGSVLVWAEYIGAKGLAEIGDFLRQLEGVRDIDLHTLVVDRGGKIEMTQTHLQVLRCLREDARMSISDVSRRTGLTKRSVRKVIQEFQGQTKTQIETLVGKQDGTEIAKPKPALYFRIYWDLNAGGGFTLVARVKWEVGKGKPEEIVNYFQKHFPLEFWFAFAAATEPVLYSVFVVDHVRTAEKILPKIKKAPHKSSLEIWISYPMRKFIGLRESLIDEMLEKAGL